MLTPLCNADGVRVWIAEAAGSMEPFALSPPDLRWRLSVQLGEGEKGSAGLRKPGPRAANVTESVNRK